MSHDAKLSPSDICIDVYVGPKSSGKGKAKVTAWGTDILYPQVALEPDAVVSPFILHC